VLDSLGKNGSEEWVREAIVGEPAIHPIVHQSAIAKGPELM
jgi:hypothetical protein